MTAIPQRSTADLPRWVYAGRGIVAIAFGALALAWPTLSLVLLVTIYGAYALVEGITAIVLGVARRREDIRWWAIVAGGIASVIAGTVVFAWPAITSLALIYVIGIWALVNGAMQIVEAFRDGWSLAVFGLLSIVFGLFVLIRPLSGALALLWAIGWWAIFAGVALTVHAVMRRPTASVGPVD